MHRKHSSAVLVVAVMTGACMDMHDGLETPEVIEMPADDRAPVVATAQDENPAPAIVEVTLRAHVAMRELLPGRAVAVWAYDATSPGPLIEANVGDRVIVHFRNDLDEPTSIHWHGLRIPADMDGGAQGPVVGPGESFDFAFDVPDAGLFWYHPHEDSRRQVELGLYGPILVRAPEEPVVDVERVLVLDDVLIQGDGELASFSSDDDMLGRQGNLLLVDGVAHPTVTVRAGSIERWRIVNVANARYFDLELPGHQLVLIGTDGGLLAEGVRIDRLLLTPGERADVLVRMDAEPGARAELRTLPYDRGDGMGHMGTDWGEVEDVMRLVYDDAIPLPTRAMPEVRGSVEQLPGPTGRDVLVLGEGDHGGMHGSGFGLTINGESWPDVTPIIARLGETRTWVLDNDSGMDHPFHLHGFRFQVVRGAGGSLPIAAWKDTVNVPAGEQVEITVALDGFAGDWMYHCHILEHADAGMMGLLEVRP